MNYETLKGEAEKAVGDFPKAFSDAKKKLALLEKRRDDAQAQLIGLEERKEKLTASSEISLADNQNAFEKFQTSLRKVSVSIEATEQALETLETKIIPAQEREVAEAGRKLTAALDAFFRKGKKRECEAAMTALLDQVVSLRDAYHDGFRRIYRDYGVRSALWQDSVLPDAKHKRISKPLEFNIVRAVAEKPAPDVTPTEAPGAAEGSLPPSEAGSQAVEAENRSEDTAETNAEPPSVTLLTGAI
jgi:hypothetical protein